MFSLSHTKKNVVFEGGAQFFSVGLDLGESLPKRSNWLVVLTILKNMKVNGKDYPIYCGK